MTISLIVGLGNPGPKYEYTRHNVGFLAVDEFVQRHQGFQWKTKDQGIYTNIETLGEPRIFLKPQNYMNLSGSVVRSFLRNHNLEPSQMMVIHDEVDLAEGDIRLKKGGGAGGHNGLLSIFENLGSQDFYRIRVGVGKSPDKELADFLLERASKTLLLDLAVRASDILQSVFEHGFVQAQNLCNKKPVPQ